jgi:hypothetical protein
VTAALRRSVVSMGSAARFHPGCAWPSCFVTCTAIVECAISSCNASHSSHRGPVVITMSLARLDAKAADSE